jgi:hypothetical protein
MIIDIIGTPAMLEQLAEECTELAQACLKYARKLRAENPTPVSIDECRRNVLIEYADVDVCITELTSRPWWSDDFVSDIEDYKLNRWRDRLHEHTGS